MVRRPILMPEKPRLPQNTKNTRLRRQAGWGRAQNASPLLVFHHQVAPWISKEPSLAENCAGVSPVRGRERLWPGAVDERSSTRGACADGPGADRRVSSAIPPARIPRAEPSVLSVRSTVVESNHGKPSGSKPNTGFFCSRLTDLGSLHHILEGCV